MANGYDCEFAESPPEKVDTDCPICLLILREPHQVSCCGKIYCQSCITKALKNSECCPTCKEDCPHHWPDKNKKQILSGLRVFCSNRSSACAWEGELGYLEKHLNKNPRRDVLEAIMEGCKFTTLVCHLCRAQIKRHNLLSHLQDSCPNRPYTCVYCGHKGTYIKVKNDHSPSCPMEPIACQHCKETFKRQEMDNHVAKDCQEVSIACDFSDVGCQVELPRKEMGSHLNVAIKSHVTLLLHHSDGNLPLFASCLELLVSEKQMLRLNVAKLLSQVEVLLSNEKQLRRQLEKLSSEKKQLHCDLTDFRTASRKLQHDLEQLASEKSQLQSDVRDLATDNIGLRCDLIDLRTTCQELRCDMEQLTSEKSQLQRQWVSENCKLQCDLIGLETANQKLQCDLEQLQGQWVSEKCKLRCDLIDLETANQKLRCELEQLQSDLEHLVSANELRRDLEKQERRLRSSMTLEKEELRHDLEKQEGRLRSIMNREFSTNSQLKLEMQKLQQKYDSKFLACAIVAVVVGICACIYVLYNK